MVYTDPKHFESIFFDAWNSFKDHVGQSNPWWVCHTWPKEPFLTMLVITSRALCAMRLARISIFSHHACPRMSGLHVCSLFIDFRTNGEVLDSF